MMANVKNYYEILHMRDKQKGQPIPAADLRHAYKQALLLHHPDKQTSRTTSPSGTVATVDEIAEAYRVLSDPELKAEYDRSLKTRENDASCTANTRHTGMETVDLEDLHFDEQALTWSRACRCESQPAFMITEAELEKNVEFGELVTGCKGCSLWLRVLFSVVD